MITVRKSNVVLKVDESLQDKYLKDGFSVIDTETGLPIIEAISTDVPTLQEKVKTLTYHNNKLNEKVKELQAVIETMGTAKVVDTEKVPVEKKSNKKAVKE